VARLADLVSKLSRVALFTDYDGVLAPIVDDPDAALPTPGLVGALAKLQNHGCRVTVVSGRPVEFLERSFTNLDADLIGLYGLERRKAGTRVRHPNADRWAQAVRTMTARAAASGPTGMVAEDKSLSLTFHYRTAPLLGDDVLRFATQLANEFGFDVRPAKMSVELHPSVDIDKGVALLEHVDDRDSCVVYLGDDEGDLAAFDALDSLTEQGRHTIKVAVASDEMPPSLGARADVVLGSQNDVIDFLATED
jgi:trehalose 6-phosphate phosphatase